MTAPSLAAVGLIEALGDPTALTGWSDADWDLFMRQARRVNLHARVALDQRIDRDRAPPRARRYLVAGRAFAADNDRRVRWEVNRIAHALGPLDAPVMLLKGAAYVFAALPPARGRLISDVDIMVPRDRLDAVEAALIAAGWETMTLEPYDQRYYRRWMHELPPMRHCERGSVIDVHHTILPPTARLRPDPALMWRAARAIDGRFHALAPADMVLHSATHLFHDGDLALALRDLVDLKDLCAHFGAVESGFWADLVPRAEALDLARPLYYALRYMGRILDARVPPEVVAAAARHAPPAPLLALMDRLAPLALLPDHPDRPRRATALALFLLYVRSHWLRMPPHLLIAHLARKATNRLAADPDVETTR